MVTMLKMFSRTVGRCRVVRVGLHGSPWVLSSMADLVKSFISRLLSTITGSCSDLESTRGCRITCALVVVEGCDALPFTMLRPNHATQSHRTECSSSVTWVFLTRM